MNCYKTPEHILDFMNVFHIPEEFENLRISFKFKHVLKMHEHFCKFLENI